jgi:hypothetical protein
VQEAANVVEPFMDGSRKVAFSGPDLARLVNRDMERGGTVGLDSLAPDTATAVRALDPGAFLAILTTPAAAGEKIMVVCWRGRGDASFNVMCSKEALFVVGHQLVSLGVEVDFSNYARAHKAPRQVSGRDAVDAATAAAAEAEEETAPVTGDAAAGEGQ